MLKENLVSRIERAIEEEAGRKGIYFPSNESVTVELKVTKEEREEFLNSDISDNNQNYWWEFYTNQYDQLMLSVSYTNDYTEEHKKLLDLAEKEFLTIEELEEIEEMQEVKRVENNGNSGSNYGYTWYSIYTEDKEHQVYVNQ